MTETDTPRLVLDHETHRAWLGDRELLRVTTILRESGLCDDEHFRMDLGAVTRGQYLHDAIRLYHNGELDEDSLDPALLPYWKGYRSFLLITHVIITLSHEPVCDDVQGYAGEYDALGHLPDVPPDTLDLFDVKTGRTPPWVDLQTIAYRRCLKIPKVRRWAVELLGNDSFVLRPLNLRDGRIDLQKDRADEAVFLAALAVVRWKREHR